MGRLTFFFPFLIARERISKIKFFYIFQYLFSKNKDLLNELYYYRDIFPVSVYIPALVVLFVSGVA